MIHLDAGLQDVTIAHTGQRESCNGAAHGRHVHEYRDFPVSVGLAHAQALAVKRRSWKRALHVVAPFVGNSIQRIEVDLTVAPFLSVARDVAAVLLHGMPALSLGDVRSWRQKNRCRLP